MGRTDWIENRILWRLESFPLGTDGVLLKDAIPARHLSEISAAYSTTSLGRPVLAFTDNSAKWTILTTELVASHHSGQIGVMNVHNGFSIDFPFAGQTFNDVSDLKSELQYLTLVHPDSRPIKVWAPKGTPCIALWNILRMFPFRQSSS